MNHLPRSFHLALCVAVLILCACTGAGSRSRQPELQWVLQQAAAEERLFDHTWWLPLQARRRGLVYTGDNERLRVVLDRYRRGEQRRMGTNHVVLTSYAERGGGRGRGVSWAG
jgi:hypothetical protein